MEPRTIGLCTFTVLTILLIFSAGCTGTAPVQPISPKVEKTSLLLKYQQNDDRGTAGFASAIVPVDSVEVAQKKRITR
jgi:hypothetical protein